MTLVCSKHESLTGEDSRSTWTRFKFLIAIESFMGERNKIESITLICHSSERSEGDIAKKHPVKRVLFCHPHLHIAGGGPINVLE